MMMTERLFSLAAAQENMASPLLFSMGETRSQRLPTDSLLALRHIGIDR